MFETPDKLLLGLLTGIIFGFFLQKGQVAKHDVIVGAFLLKDFTAVKIMATAALIASAGVYLFFQQELISLHIKEAQLGSIIVGGLLFGAGLVFYGYCPGTGVAASGEGHHDATIGIFGMLFGAILYVLTYKYIERSEDFFPDFGKVTLPEITNSSPWIWVGAFFVSYFTVKNLYKRLA